VENLGKIQEGHGSWFNKQRRGASDLDVCCDSTHGAMENLVHSRFFEIPLKRYVKTQGSPLCRFLIYICRLSHFPFPLASSDSMKVRSAGS